MNKDNETQAGLLQMEQLENDAAQSAGGQKPERIQRAGNTAAQIQQALDLWEGQGSVQEMKKAAAAQSVPAPVSVPTPAPAPETPLPPEAPAEETPEPAEAEAEPEESDEPEEPTRVWSVMPHEMRDEEEDVSATRVLSAGLGEAETAAEAEDDSDMKQVSEEAEAPAEPAETPDAPETEETEEAEEAAGEEYADEGPHSREEIGTMLKKMTAASTIRCALSGILAAALIVLNLIGEGFIPAIQGLDPVAAPAAFMGANLLLMAAALVVSLPILRGGIASLRGEPSVDGMVSAAAVAASLQAVAAMLSAESYRLSGCTLMTGAAALLLFMDHLGCRLELNAVNGNYALLCKDLPHRCAYRTRDIELVRTLAQGMDDADPWVLLSRPMSWPGDFVERSFSPRAGEKMAARLQWVLIGASVAAGLAGLAMGRGINGAAAGMATMACLCAPLSVTLVMGAASMRMQHTASSAGAVVPGWADIEELGGIEVIHTDADQLFPRECAVMKDIRIFKGGRIDVAILCAASVLNRACSTLSDMFREVVVGRTDMLLPIDSLKKEAGLGFEAWCEKFHILLGTREMMAQREIPLPTEEYEAEHSENGKLQVLYLAISERLVSMFTIQYKGARTVANRLKRLQDENVRLLVTCDDPTLTETRINELYHLPEGFLHVMTQEQNEAAVPALTEVGDGSGCLYHLEGLSSVTEGLCAAYRAQSAEMGGTGIQRVSIWVSVIIGLLLTYAGNIGMLSALAVLMYQAAWSALALAFTMMKQR